MMPIDRPGCGLKKSLRAFKKHKQFWPITSLIKRKLSYLTDPNMLLTISFLEVDVVVVVVAELFSLLTGPLACGAA